MKLAKIRIVVVLPAPFGPREPHDFTFADFKIQILDRRLAGVTFGEIFDLNHFAILP